MNLEAAKAWDVIVIGAGAAGLVAGERAALLGNRTLVVEKSRKAGVKILMSGGTRCNITQNTDRRGIVEAFGRQGRFLNSPLAHLDPSSVVRLFEDSGVKTKVESTGKIFPVSDRAIDVRDALVQRLRHSGAELRLGCGVSDIEFDQSSSRSLFRVSTVHGEETCGRLILTTGGMSYPGCGTTGDGYPWAKKLGHKIVSPAPALTPLTTTDSWTQELSGITFEDVGFRLELTERNQDLAKQWGRTPADRDSLLLTHFGFSGPAAMNVSRVVHRYPKSAWRACLDLFPDRSQQQVIDGIVERSRRHGKRSLSNILAESLPPRFVDGLLRELSIDGQARGAELSRKSSNRLGQACKRLEIPIAGTRGFPKAEVTSGGVELTEVDSKTMQSKCCEGLFLAGEILDLDGPIGGFNFQAAFSTGWLAGHVGRPPSCYSTDA